MSTRTLSRDAVPIAEFAHRVSMRHSSKMLATTSFVFGRYRGR